ncbi:MAG: RAMP superfamily CRISPR-associated protein [Capsulimonadaceae bacterium]
MANEDRRVLQSRWIVTGTIDVETASQIGSVAAETGDQTFVRTDDGRVMLPGSTLTGALRGALEDRLAGYRQDLPAPVVGQASLPVLLRLFGWLGRDDGKGIGGSQSCLIVFSSASDQLAPAAVRDGVRIDPKTGTAADKLKFDREVAAPGLRFPIRIELLVPDDEHEDEPALLGALLAALQPLASGRGAFGARKTRGLGRARATGFRAVRFDLKTAKGWMDYAAMDPDRPIDPAIPAEDDPGKALRRAWPGVDASPLPDEQRREFTIRLDLDVQGTLLIRAPGLYADSSDAVHLSEVDCDRKLRRIVSGTSIAGALRSQCIRIVNTLAPDSARGSRLVRDVFGPSPEEITKDGIKPAGSRLRVCEAVLSGERSHRQTRVKIDRLTGGTIEGALFDEEPAVLGQVTIDLSLRLPPAESKSWPDSDAGTGLVLLAARDLADGFLPLGGGAGVGRGYLKGTMTVTKPDGGEATTPELESYVAALNRVIKGTAAVEVSA